MLFCKKVLLLKEISYGFSSSVSPVSGILRLEQEDCVSTLNLTLVNIASKSGNYYLYLCFDKKTIFSFDLGRRPFSFNEKNDAFPSADYGFCAGIVFIKDNIPTVVAFSRTENFSMLIHDFKKIVADRCIKEFNKTYDDEVVATENYFKDDDISSKLEIIKNLDIDYVQNENALPDSSNKGQTEKNETDTFFGQDETNSPSRKDCSESTPYYFKVKKELDGIFSRFPLEEKLCALTPDGVWVKVGYGNQKFYVVGLIRECGKEKYICYGVPSKYREVPPKELAGYASFVPLSVFDLKGDGYFIMFQDAITGKSVKLN